MPSRSCLARVLSVAAVVAVAVAVAPLAASAAPVVLVDPGPAFAPGAASSTSGDFATDTYGNPWDFADDADIVAVPEVANSFGLPATRVASTGFSSVDGGGWLVVDTVPTSEVRLHFDWPAVLPWGRDGRAHPIDASVYRRLSLRLCVSGNPIRGAIRWWNTAGTRGTIGLLDTLPSGCSDVRVDLADPATGPTRGRYDGVEAGPWGGLVTRLVFFRAPADGPLTDGARTLSIDYARVHRPDTPWGPAGDVPRPVVLTPSAEGEGDWATEVRGRPWSFDGPGDVVDTNDLMGAHLAGGAFVAANTGNDPFVALDAPVPIDGSRYHRLTVDACMDGRFNLGGGPGQGTVGRLAWIPDGQASWTETQDVVVFPGCHRMTIDLATTPAGALHDESSATRPGWVCQSTAQVRWDPFEDPGAGRTFALNEVKLGRDPSFSTTTTVRFRDDNPKSGAVADLTVSTDPSAIGGTLVRSGVPVTSGVTSLTWDGTDASGVRLPAGRYWLQVQVRHPGGATTTVEAPSFIDYLPPAVEGPSTFVPLAPSRVLDTRAAPTPVNGCQAPVGARGQIDIEVTGRAGVPRDGVTAVVLNVTGITPTADSYVTVWPTGAPRPLASNLNVAPGGIRPNLVTAKVGAGGRVSLYNDAGAIHLAADVVGYFTADPSATRFVPVTPVRAFDTREAGGRLGPKQTRRFRVAGLPGVPQGAAAIALNVTGVLPTATTYLTVFPSGPVPLASNLNVLAGRIAPNLVTVPVEADGTVAIYNDAGAIDVVGDVVGYFSADRSITSRFVAVNPQRAFDTRDAGAPLGPASSRTFPVTGLSQVPAGVSGVAINVTAVSPTASTFLTVWPTGEGRPWASSLNAAPGDVVANLVFAKVGAGGAIDVYNDAGATHVVGDVIGYFT